MKDKIINFNSEKDIKKFDKKIWIYKNIFYHNVNFILKNNTNNHLYDDVIIALNLKKKKERINYIYDKSCDIIDNHNKENKVDCSFKNGKCLCQYDTKFDNGCCRLCTFQSTEGCRTRNLTCKFFFCSEIKNKYNILTFKDIKLLKCLSFRNKIIVRDNFFVSRESYLNTLYTSSIIIYTLKQLFNIIKIIKKQITLKFVSKV